MTSPLPVSYTPKCPVQCKVDRLSVSQRGVVFFRAQDNLTDDLQKVLIQRLGELAGKPAESTLHVHPFTNTTKEFASPDPEISTISSYSRKYLAEQRPKGEPRRGDDTRSGAAIWHSDIQFEPVPADYTSLRLTELPETGGDTLWASGYELYDSFSEAYQKFFEGLTATFQGQGFIKNAKAHPDKYTINENERGNPANVGKALEAIHPVVRTNPVTGWKSIFSVGPFPTRINELSARESRELLDRFYRLILDNHDLQVRFRWRNKNDIGEFPAVCHIVDAETDWGCSDLGQPQRLPQRHQRLRPSRRPGG